MFRLTKPNEDEVIHYLFEHKGKPLSYDDLGVTQQQEVRGFQVDVEETLLGHGRDTFETAKQAIREWRMFPREMCELYWPDRPVDEGVVVATLFRAGPMWSLNPCRIVYTVDESNEQTERFGFAYGTLDDHLECGEELFLVEWDRADNSVRYHLRACSRPQHPLSFVGYPYVRLQQAKFRRLSAAAMRRVVDAHKSTIAA